MGLTKIRVLLVDDNDDLRETIRAGLEHLGFHIFDVNSGSKALYVLSKRQDEFDIVLSDVEMPDGGGFWLIEQLKKANIKIPVVLSSGSIQMDVAMAIKQGATGFLPKPARMSDLAGMLTTYAERQPSRKSA